MNSVYTTQPLLNLARHQSRVVYANQIRIRALLFHRNHYQIFVGGMPKYLARLVPD